VELLPAGNVAGSRVALVTDPDGTRYLYTGDVCTRSRFYLDGLEPPDADVLVVESTYGEPEYVFPDHETVAGEIRTWLAETADPVVLFGYALGRAQKLHVRQRTVHLGRGVAGRRCPRPADDDGPHRLDSVARAESDAVTTGFPGWAVDDAYRFRGDYDVTFPPSDHCDFGELVDAVDPERVDTQHGFADAFAGT
jgi:putative mRNA 3-end processing factor